MIELRPSLCSAMISRFCISSQAAPFEEPDNRAMNPLGHSGYLGIARRMQLPRL
jgi:hypothetical protein